MLSNTFCFIKRIKLESPDCRQTVPNVRLKQADVLDDIAITFKGRKEIIIKFYPKINHF